MINLIICIGLFIVVLIALSGVTFLILYTIIWIINSIKYYNIDRKEPLVNIGDFVVEKERNYEWEVTNIYKDKYEGIWYISVRCPISLQEYMSHSEFYKTFNTSK